ncbi:MAG: glycosyltransferase [Chloroflexi bacterium]|nr:glycosyltransferase [Chloroflexota bacterium]MCY3958797.1 glycosyltransferase [Chloroflexota bacterium]
MRLVLVGGGTAGHIFPTIAVAQQVAAMAGSTAKLTAVCGSRDLDRLLYRDADLELLPLPARGLVGVDWWRLPWRAWLLIQSLFSIWRDFSRQRPAAVIASGGYVSAPVLLVSWLQRIPSVIFSGDAALGWATRLMAPLTSSATIAFDEARHQIWRTPVELAGYPVRASFAEPDASRGRAEYGVANGEPLIVVMGGSQGAHVINEALRADLARLLPKAHVVHLSGRPDYRSLRSERDRLDASLRPRYHLHAFVEHGFADLLAAADIVVGRAGATSVAELSAVGTAAVLIPGTFGAGHQIATARAMATAGAALMLPEAELSSGGLVRTLLGLLTEPKRLRALGAASKSRGQPDAAARIAAIGLRLAGYSSTTNE